MATIDGKIKAVNTMESRLEMLNRQVRHSSRPCYYRGYIPYISIFHVRLYAVESCCKDIGNYRRV